MKLKTLALSLLAAGVLAGCSAHSSVDTMKSDKIIIAHRGASGYLPEHTLESVSYTHLTLPTILRV